MSGRRGGNRIRGPQSALTDFLAANNISAAQIRDDYERRRAQAAADAPAAEGASTAVPLTADDEEIAAALELEEETKKKSKKRKRQQDEAIDKIKKAKTKKSKKKKKSEDSDADEDGDYDDDFAKNRYRKARPLPGQLEHCEICNKRFTVTPYSKEGPDGGLMCGPCGKELAKDSKAEKKPVKKPAGQRRRKMESERLDGMSGRGAKPLLEMCIRKLGENHEAIEELGDIPETALGRLGEIFSKKRVLKPKTLPLFLRPDLDSVIIHEAAYLEAEDYHQIFAVVPNMRKLVLSNACQFKDGSVDYMLERCHQLRHLHLYAANLVSDEMWLRLFQEMGERLEALKLQWLDAAFDDTAVAQIQQHCPNLHRLKLKLCRRIGQDAIESITAMEKLEHLTIRLNRDVTNEALTTLIQERGPALKTLCLEGFIDADDTVVQRIHDSCGNLSKLRFSENDTVSDAAFTALFTNWPNPPLTYADFNSTRDVDNNNPNGPEDVPIGMGSNAFQALMAHSGHNLKHLDIASCRHIELKAFLDVFEGGKEYAALEHINISFCKHVEDTVVAGIFKTCPKLKKLIAFGCFQISDVVVPRDVVVIGVPKAQDAIEQFGGGLDVQEAISSMHEMHERMVEAAA